jgi:CBS domain-containing protein
VDYESDDLGDVVSILSNRGAHRVPVMKGNELLGVITQSQILDWVWEHKKTVAHLNAINIKVLELAVYRDIVTVHEETKALQAFRLMDYARVSGVAVVDDNNEMLSVLSVKDLRVIADPKFDRVHRERWIDLHNVLLAPNFCCSLGELF